MPVAPGLLAVAQPESTQMKDTVFSHQGGSGKPTAAEPNVLALPDAWMLLDLGLADLAQEGFRIHWECVAA